MAGAWASAASVKGPSENMDFPLFPEGKLSGSMLWTVRQDTGTDIRTGTEIVADSIFLN